MSSQSKRPPLKLKLSTTSHIPTQPSSASSTPTSAPKLKLKFGAGSSKPSTPTASSATPTVSKKAKKAARPRKSDQTIILKASPAPAPAPSSTASKKRSKERDEDDDQEEAALPTKKAKILKITNKGPLTPIIKTKLKGKPPPRPLGVGYDSELSDRELDPSIEEEFVLRMQPGDDCDYLRKAIEEKRLGVSRRDGGADVTMKFFDREGRRAVVTIRQRHYAATMVDLPCIVEGMKSWDRRGWWKSADICQMLLVIGRVESEEAALSVPLPAELDQKTFQWPHGLTPPMRHVRRRRFRKRISNKTIEAVEEEVERLLADDAACAPGGSRYDLLDLDRMTRDNSTAASEAEGAAGGYNMLGAAGMQSAGDYDDAEEEYEDGDGEMIDEGDFFDDADLAAGLEADLEAAMMQDDAAAATATSTAAVTMANTSANSHTDHAHAHAHAPTATTTAATTPGATVISPALSTPGLTTTPSADDNDDDDDDDDDDSGSDDGSTAAAAADAADDDELEQQQEQQRLREEIADLEEKISNSRRELESLTIPFMREKKSKTIRELKAILEVKKAEAGLDTGDAV